MGSSLEWVYVIDAQASAVHVPRIRGSSRHVGDMTFDSVPNFGVLECGEYFVRCFTMRGIPSQRLTRMVRKDASACSTISRSMDRVPIPEGTATLKPDMIAPFRNGKPDSPVQTAAAQSWTLLTSLMESIMAAEKLSLVELLNLANEGYADGYLAEYFDPETGERRQGSGDTLAQFIVAELQDTFDAEASRSAQLQEARRVLSHAIDDLQGVIDRLQ